MYTPGCTTVPATVPSVKEGAVPVRVTAPVVSSIPWM